MVNNPALLTNVRPIATRYIIVGNGSKVRKSSSGTLQLGKAIFDGVFVAMGLDKN
jgi:hypothetical protein